MGTRSLDLATGRLWSITVSSECEVVPGVGPAELRGVLLLITDTWNNSERNPSSGALRTEN